jgi:hypothetical protein
MLRDWHVKRSGKRRSNVSIKVLVREKSDATGWKTRDKADYRRRAIRTAPAYTVLLRRKASNVIPSTMPCVFKY